TRSRSASGEILPDGGPVAGGATAAGGFAGVGGDAAGTRAELPEAAEPEGAGVRRDGFPVGRPEGRGAAAGAGGRGRGRAGRRARARPWAPRGGGGAWARGSPPPRA